ncbi:MULTISPECIES: Gx transporter family protein [Aminobacterium]|jgi:heptaprenyl diphosphate synthase|uniref:Gx transporter family protein n=1 Tax=Aminobacterium TaxID=81466 RepID=UPI00257F7BD3|nr:Gx transporter family protein [Aminobacterium sp. UBA4987]
MLRAKLKAMIVIGLLVGLALTIHVAEAQIPMVFPGIKLGLANIITLMALDLYGWKEALMVTLLRVGLGAFFTGNAISFLCSFTGGLLSCLFMIELHRRFKESVTLPYISIAGAISHNIGQLIVIVLIIQNLYVFLYLPVLLVSGVITGYGTGFLASLLSSRIKKVPGIL